MSCRTFTQKIEFYCQQLHCLMSDIHKRRLKHVEPLNAGSFGAVLTFKYEYEHVHLFLIEEHTLKGYQFPITK